MNKKLGLIDQILSGEKTIESRCYVHKIAPWDKVFPGERVYFKDSGGPIRAKATVVKVLQFSNPDEFPEIIHKYSQKICLTNFPNGKNYCILIFLKDPKIVEPFMITKSGFGSATAWLVVKDVNSIKVS